MPICYIWNFVSTSFGTNSSESAYSLLTQQTEAIAYLWIQDPFESSTLTLTPSSRSKELTQLFWNLGDVPSLTTNYASSPLLINNVTYFQDDKIWKISFTTPLKTAGASLTIAESQLSVYSCKVAVSTLELSILPSTNLPSWSPASSSTSSTLFSFLRNTCAPNLYLLSNTTSLSYSNNGLRSITRLGPYSPAAFHQNYTLLDATNLLGVSSLIIKSPSTCVFSTPWLAYTSTSILLPDLTRILVSGVLDVDMDPFQNNLYALVRINPQLIQLIQYLSSTPTILANFSSSSSLALDNGLKGSIPKFTFSKNKNGAMFLYGDQVLYSPDFGTTIFPIRLILRNPEVLTLSPSDSIVQLITSFSTNHVAILTSNRRLFLTQIGLQEAIELDAAALFSRYSSFQLEFLMDGSLIAVGSIPTAPYYLIQSIPITSDLSVPSWNATGYTCPTYQFSTNQTKDETYYLDYGEAITFSANFVTDILSPSSLSLFLPNSSFLDFQLSSTSFSSDNYQFTQSSWNLTPSDPFITGTTSMMSVLNPSNFSCPSLPVSKIKATCPPGRSLIVEFPDQSQVPCPSSPYSILQNEYIDPITLKPGVSAFSVTYNCSKYGLPFKLFYGYHVAPILKVIDANGRVVDRVDSDFMLVETQGQTTFKYNSTFNEVGCLHPLNMSSNLSTWSRNNYYPCYKGSSVPSGAWSSNPYPILNATNFNRLRWTSGRETYYTFKAVVLDPEFSYCSFSTHFGVYVYGAPLSMGANFGILFGIMAVSFIILALSYWWHRKENLKEREKEKEKEKDE